MHPKQGRIKFYSEDDMSVGIELDKSESIIVNFDANKKIDSINEIIELYNIQELMNTGVILKKWSAETYEELKLKASTFTVCIAKFFSQICDDNFIEYVQKVDAGYLEDFWSLFEYYKVYQRITPEKFADYLMRPDTTLYFILKHKNIVKAYDNQIATILRLSNQTCRILVTNFLEKNEEKYYFPESFHPSEFESIFQKYIDGDCVNPHILKLIYDAQSTGECPVSDKIRLNAKRKFDEYWKSPNINVINTGYEIGIGFVKQESLKEYKNDGLKYFISYDVKWLEENLDYPTILNNFFYVFEMFDICWRSTLVSVKSQIGVFERIFATNGIKFYRRGNSFHVGENISSMQMMMYYDFLKAHDVDLENVFAWFFSDYLKDEFGADGFIMKASSATDYAEKCRTLSSEMDGVLKQYRMYVRDGYIDRELFEMSSEHMFANDIPSLIEDKYAYACSKEIQQEMAMLFSDQTMLSYTEKTQSKYSTLFNLLQNEKIIMSDFADFQVASLNRLKDRHSIIINDDGSLELNKARVCLLKDLYEHEVICLQYWEDWKYILDEMRENGDIRFESLLFSNPEKDYINYILNKAEFSDGLDLRNKYGHGTYPQDENIQKRDYVELLKIMVIIVSKINEEFCLREQQKGVTT